MGRISVFTGPIMTKEKEYQDEELLYELYWEDEMTQEEIGEELGCSRQLISHYFREYGIERRDPTEQEITHYEDREWYDEDHLRHMYCQEEMTQEEIGDELGVDRHTIGKAMDYADIKVRSVSEQHKVNGNYGVSFRFDNDGYPRLDISLRDETYAVQVHRVLAMVDHSLEDLDGMHVHHKNGMKVDNRLSNLEVLTESEHNSLHAQEKEFWKESPNYTEEVA